MSEHQWQWTKEQIARIRMSEVKARLTFDPLDVRHIGAGFIARNAYDIRRDTYKTCLSCGSETQPCCGH